MAFLHQVFYTQPPTMLPDLESGSDLCSARTSIKFNISNCSESDGTHVSLDIGLKPTYFSIVSCSLSCAGSVLIFVAYFALKGIRNGAQKIITLLALADFFTALGYLVADWNFLQNSQDQGSCTVFDEVCRVQSFVTSTSSLCSFGWTCALALHFYLLLSSKKITSLSCLLVWENVVLWVFPLLITLPLLISGKLGFSGFATSNWCFIRDLNSTREEIGLILVGGKLWELISYLFVMILYTLTMIRFNRQVIKSREREPMLEVDGSQVSAQREARAEVKQRLLLIPITFIVLRMWGTLQFFYSLARQRAMNSHCWSKSDQNILITLGIAQAIGDGGQGWSNALLYIFLSPTIRRQLFMLPFIRLLQKLMANKEQKQQQQQPLVRDDMPHEQQQQIQGRVMGRRDSGVLPPPQSSTSGGVLKLKVTDDYSSI